MGNLESNKDAAAACNVPFNAAVGDDSEPYEVCRLFLAALQLCNHGNVKITQGENGDPFNIQLLSTVKAVDMTHAPN